MQLSRASSCDAYGVRALARAACRAGQANRPFRASGPTLALMQIVRTADAGYAFVRWPSGGRLEWVDPQAVVGLRRSSSQPQSATVR